jgi:beta-ribofuranosylaminobenzene 5'-phosphate synthase
MSRDAEEQFGPDGFLITTGSRLHFGLLDTVAPFGGAGLMITQPETVVRFQAADPAEGFSTCETAPQRVLQVVERFAQHVGYQKLPPVRITIERCPAAHAGLGSGTQLNMAVAEGVCRIAGVSLPADLLAAKIAARGLRSAVGLHGYFLGGCIYERATSDMVAAEPNVDDTQYGINPVRCRMNFPVEWHVALLRPSGTPTIKIAGQAEQQRFRQLNRPAASVRKALAGMVERTMLPAIEALDFSAFCESVHRYNRRSGEFFAAVQGGPYNGPAISNGIDALRSLGFHGVGQSSWGPTIFVFCESSQRVEILRESTIDGWEVDQVATAQNSGRKIRAL